MTAVGRVESLWRYPVKSMRGEGLRQAFVGFAGVYGDRFYAFVRSNGPKRFPYLTGRQKEEMLLYRPVYRHTEHMVEPPNLAEAQTGKTGATPLYPDAEGFMVDVLTPPGDRLAIDDPQLNRMLREGLGNGHELTLLRSHRSMTDCRPISLLSVQTIQQLSEEAGADLDKRRFRANVYLALDSEQGFGENEFVGRSLHIGDKAVVAVVARDSRCKMITLDPDTAKPDAAILQRLTQAHDGKAGVYGAVVVEGTVRPGDPVTLLGQLATAQ